MAKSEIIFCPYNYLIEPHIRKSMDIRIRGQVFILDEAHNIEDSARSAASFKVTQEEFREALQDLERVAQMMVPEAESLSELALDFLTYRVLILLTG